MQRNPFTYPKPITLDSLGDLFAFHRDRFGGFRMGDEPTPEEKAAAEKAAADAKEKGGEGYKPPATQADLDRIIQDRITRERTKFEGFDDYKKKANEFDKAAEAARTDQEKAVEAAKNEGRTEALTAANTRLLSAEARALAAEAKFASPTLAVRALDLSDVKVNDDGSVDAEAIKAKLKELADSGAFVIGDGKRPPPKPDGSQGGGGGTDGPSVERGRQLARDRGKNKAVNKTPA